MDEGEVGEGRGGWVRGGKGEGVRKECEGRNEFLCCLYVCLSHLSSLLLFPFWCVKRSSDDLEEEEEEEEVVEKRKRERQFKKDKKERGKEITVHFLPDLAMGKVCI